MNQQRALITEPVVYRAEDSSGTAIIRGSEPASSLTMLGRAMITYGTHARRGCRDKLSLTRTKEEKWR